MTATLLWVDEGLEDGLEVVAVGAHVEDHGADLERGAADDLCGERR